METGNCQVVCGIRLADKTISIIHQVISECGEFVQRVIRAKSLMKFEANGFTLDGLLRLGALWITWCVSSSGAATGSTTCNIGSGWRTSLRHVRSL